jgi:hypothetical protein
MCRDPLSTEGFDYGFINSKHDDVVDTATTRNSEPLEDGSLHNFATTKTDMFAPLKPSSQVFTPLASSEIFSSFQYAGPTVVSISAF